LPSASQRLSVEGDTPFIFAASEILNLLRLTV
jgi:hypothetical protein